MADTYISPKQSLASAGVLTDLYTVPGATSAVVPTLMCCNQSSTLNAYIRVSIAPAGAADASSQYLYYDVKLSPNESRALTVGMTLATTDVLRVRSDSGQVSFTAFVLQIT